MDDTEKINREISSILQFNKRGLPRVVLTNFKDINIEQSFSNKPQLEQDKRAMEPKKGNKMKKIVPRGPQRSNINIPNKKSKLGTKYNCLDVVPSCSKSEARKDNLFSSTEENGRKYGGMQKSDLQQKGIEATSKSTEKFNQIIELIAQDNNNNSSKAGGEIITQSIMEELVNEAAQLKASGLVCIIPLDTLINTLYIMEKNIKSGEKYPFKINEDTRRIERLIGASNACLVSFYIMTSPNMPKRIYLEDVIQEMILFIKNQLENFIFPTYDKTYTSGLKNKLIQISDDMGKLLNDKVFKLLSLLTEFLNIQVLTEHLVTQVASMAIGAFFVKNVASLQPACLIIIRTVFARYQKQNRVVLEQILMLGIQKHGARYFLDDENIYMVTSLVLQLIQCVAFFPESLLKDGIKNTKGIKDNLIYNKYEMVVNTAALFSKMFIICCMQKSEDTRHKLFFESFITDLILLVNTPKWPASSLLLNYIAILLAKKFSDKQVEVSVRVLSLHYLDLIVVGLRNRTNEKQIEEINKEVEKLKYFEMKQPMEYKEKKIEFLQDLLLEYLTEHGKNNETVQIALHFYVAQWYNQAIDQIITVLGTQPSKKNKLKRKRGKVNACIEVPTSETYEDLELRKKQLLNKLQPDENRIKLQIEYNEVVLIIEYLTSESSLTYFQKYLHTILIALKEPTTVIRAKVIKCLGSIITADPSLLTHSDIQSSINYSCLDSESQVREAVLELIGKFIFTQPTLIDKYYEVLSARILDTSTTVRKKVIKILIDICVKHPDYAKVPEICVKIIRRVADEGGIGKLVVDVFQNIWFTPTSESVSDKVKNITAVVAEFKDVGLQCFEQLIENLYQPKRDRFDCNKILKEASKSVILASKQIIDCLTKNILDTNSSSLVYYSTTLSIFAKIQPSLLVPHVGQLQTLLSLKKRSKEAVQVVSDAAQILSLVVTLIPKPEKNFLAKLEQDCVNLVYQGERSMIVSSITCLGSIINNITCNFDTVRNCLKKFYYYLTRITELMTSGIGNNTLGDVRHRNYVKKALFIVGLLLRSFDFKKKEVIGELSTNIVDEVFEVLLFLLEHINEQDIQMDVIKAIRSLCGRYYEFILDNRLKTHYQRLLTSAQTFLAIKSEILTNIESYLIEDDQRMMKEDINWTNCSKQESLKKLDDQSSGRASTVIQQYSKEVLESYLNPNMQVRKPALRVVQLILQQGLIHPAQIIPYLICMSTDSEMTVSHAADKQMLDMQRKYPDLIHSKSSLGVKLSYRLQTILQKIPIIRGYRINDDAEYPISLNAYLYSLLQNNRQQRRGFVLNILKQFNEDHTNLAFMLYLADNVAYFPYAVQDEPLFILHHINIMISFSGTNLLQSFQEGLLKIEVQEDQAVEISALDEDDDKDGLLARLPEDTLKLQEYIAASQGCLLLLMLKQHLKNAYGLNDGKIDEYSPIESTKLYDKPINRKSNEHFNPSTAIKGLEQNFQPKELDEEGRINLITAYLEFKQLMLKLDRDKENVANNSIMSSSSCSVLSLAVLKPMRKSRASKGNSRRAKPRRKKAKLVLSSDDDDSDPDFML